MIPLVAVGLLLVLLVAPLRRALLGGRAWQFTLPFIAGAGLGWIFFFDKSRMAGAPWWMAIVLPLFGGVILGGVVWSAFRDVLGPPNNRS